MANYRILHEYLPQYKFYWYEGFLGIAAGIGGHNNYIKNTVEVFTKSLDEYKSNWINKTFSEAIGIRNEILNRDDFLNEFYLYGVSNYNPSLMIKAFGDDFLTDLNKYKDLIIRLLYFSIYNVDSINFSQYNNFKEVIEPTFSCFDYFSTLENDSEYSLAENDSERIDVIENHIYDFFDEISAKINNLYTGLQFHYENPIIFNEVYLSKYKFFYDTTDTENTSYYLIKNLIDSFKTAANQFKERVNEENINLYTNLYINKIINDENDFSTFLPSDSLNATSYISRDYLAIRILWHCFNNIKEDFVIRTFKGFQSYGNVVGDSIDYGEVIGKIEIDLLNNDGLFFNEFRNDIITYFETLTPIIEDHYSFRLSENIPIKYSTFIDKELSETENYNLEYKFFSSLVFNYKKAKEEYVSKRINAYSKLSDKSRDSETAETSRILSNILYSEFLAGSLFGANYLNEDPYFGNEEYIGLASKFLYYISFSPEYTEEKPRRHYQYSISFYREFISNIYDLEEEDFYNNYENYFKQVIPDFAKAIEEDFFRAYEKEKENFNLGTQALNSIYKEEILPSGFNNKYKIFMVKNKNLDLMKKLLELWENKIKEYEYLLIGNLIEKASTLKNEFLYRAPGTVGSINRGKVSSTEIWKLEDYKFIIQKMAFFYIYLIDNGNDNYPQESSFELETIYEFEPRIESINEITENISGTYKILIDGKKYSVEKLFELFIDEAERILQEISERAEYQRRNLELINANEIASKAYNDYIGSIKNNFSFEKDYFYIENSIGKRTIPSSPAIDIEFMVYDNNNKTEWVSVSNRGINPREKIANLDLFHDNYFERMSLEDTGGKKEISLSLKSVDDINLEKIILNSLMKPTELFNKELGVNNSKQESVETINKSSNYRMANFRIRFGYNDIPKDSSSAISEKEITSPIFSNRINNEVPVIKSPWLYFLINKIETNFIGESITFEIGGINVGSYVLEEFKIYSKTNYNSLESVTAEQAIGIISKVLFDSSNGTICVLSDKENEIITGNSSTDRFSYKKITTTGNYKLGKSDLDFDPFDIQFLAEGKIRKIKVKNFEIKTEDEEGNKSLPTAKELLDALTDFLPTRLYGVPELKGGEKIAFPVEKDKISFIKDFAKELKMSYEVIECEAGISENGMSNSSSRTNKRRTFIRIYYKGPISRNMPSTEKIRFYKYRGTENSVVKSVRIENPMNFQKIYGVIGSYESGRDAVIYASKISNAVSSAGSFKGEKKEVIIENEDSILVPKEDIKQSSNSILEDVTTGNLEQRITSMSLNKISEISNGLTRYVYEGEMEILGDPYFIFDDDVEPWRNMIYLKINRYENLKNESLLENSFDYYSGLYILKKINHEISSSGDFTTRLGIVKFTMKKEEEE